MPHDFQKHNYNLKPLDNFYFCFINLSLNVLQQLEFIPCILNSENSPARHTGEKQWSKRNSSARRQIYNYLAFLTAILSCFSFFWFYFLHTQSIKWLWIPRSALFWSRTERVPGRSRGAQQMVLGNLKLKILKPLPQPKYSVIPWALLDYFPSITSPSCDKPDLLF